MLEEVTGSNHQKNNQKNNNTETQTKIGHSENERQCVKKKRQTGLEEKKKMELNREGEDRQGG